MGRQSGLADAGHLGVIPTRRRRRSRLIIYGREPGTSRDTDEPGSKISPFKPDAAVVRGQIDEYFEHPPAAADLYAIVEVADSSLALDLGIKLPASAAAGVRQYVVVDLVADRVLVHEEPTGES
jgi:hypothetical protein